MKLFFIGLLVASTGLNYAYAESKGDRKPNSESNSSLLRKIKKTATYRKYASENKLTCNSVDEVLLSKAYSSLSEEAVGTIFQLVVLNCRARMDDGGDPVQEKGIAVIVRNSTAGFEVATFTSHYYPQPD